MPPPPLLLPTHSFAIALMAQSLRSGSDLAHATCTTAPVSMIAVSRLCQFRDCVGFAFAFLRGSPIESEMHTKSWGRQ